MTTSLPAPLRETPEAWLTVLTRVMARITANADREGVLGALVDGLVEEFGVALARIWLYDPADDAMHARATAGDVTDLAGSSSFIPLKDAVWPVARAMAEHRVVVIEEIGPESGVRNLDWARRQGLRSFAGFPLLIGDRLIGAMVVYCRTSPPPLMREALGVLAQQAALALEHARLLEESHTLQVVAAELASARDTNALLEGIVERTMAALGADACVVWLLDEGEGSLLPGAARGLSAGFFDQILTQATDAGSASTAAVFMELRRTGRPLYSRDAQSDARGRNLVLAEVFAAEGIVSALRLPLFEPGGQVTGMLALYHRQERLYSESEVRLAQVFTDQIAVALHNARLAEKERAAREAAARQLERLTTLAQITEQLLATTDLDQVLRVVVEAAGRLCDASGAMVALLDAGRRRMTVAAAHGPLRTYFEERAPQVILDDPDFLATATGRAYATGGTVVVEDYAAWPQANPAQAQSLAAGVRAIVAAPLRVEGAVIGILWVGDVVARPFAPEDVALVEALADQAALAIEHARLERRSRDAAVLEERARLARDLHDSVTQTVFSLSMLARAAQTQHARSAGALGATLERIGTLAQEALTEMRALLFELRPSALAEEGLAAALEKLVASYRARMDAPLVYTYTGEAAVRLPEETETAIFRIVQEALGNAVKHARATQVALTLAAADGRLTVTVVDNGTGFDPGAPPAAAPDGRSGGMGMRTMRERAAAAGLTLRVASTPGAGTTVTVAVPLPPPTEPPARVA